MELGGDDLTLIVAIAVVICLVMEGVFDGFFFQIKRKVLNLISKLSSTMTFIIEENQSSECNQMFCAAEYYLSPRVQASSLDRKIVVRRENRWTFGLANGYTLIDNYDGQVMKWRMVHDIGKSRRLELSFLKGNKSLVYDVYLENIYREWKDGKHGKDIIVYVLQSQDGKKIWKPLKFANCSNFLNLPMDGIMKNRLKENLRNFVMWRDDTHTRIYGVNGPEGPESANLNVTDLIHAMADFVEFEVYDLSLRKIDTEEELRRLLSEISPNTMLVVSSSRVDEDKFKWDAIHDFVTDVMSWDTAKEGLIVVFLNMDRQEQELKRYKFDLEIY